jgi:hypothetical protein
MSICEDKCSPCEIQGAKQLFFFPFSLFKQNSGTSFFLFFFFSFGSKFDSFLWVLLFDVKYWYSFYIRKLGWRATHRQSLSCLLRRKHKRQYIIIQYAEITHTQFEVYSTKGIPEFTKIKSKSFLRFCPRPLF